MPQFIYDDILIVVNKGFQHEICNPGYFEVYGKQTQVK